MKSPCTSNVDHAWSFPSDQGSKLDRKNEKATQNTTTLPDIVVINVTADDLTP